MPLARRQAWEALGWTESSWHGRRPAPVSRLKHWAELSPAEQAAATHGLGYAADSWNAELDAACPVALASAPRASPGAPPQAAQDHPAPLGQSGGEAAGGGRGELLAKAFPWVKLAAKVAATTASKCKAGACPSALGSMMDVVASIADNMVDGGAGEGVTVSGREDVVYLDDSGSMTDKMPKAHDLLSDMGKLLQVNPVRILKFGSRKHLLVPRSVGFSPMAANLHWDASSGSTYMWHMILEDIQASYRPGPGRLRAFVVTDGGDTDSPAQYRGMQGMDPMMKELQLAGYDVEFHIIFVSGVAHALARAFGAEGLTTGDLGRYRDLAEATGGGFLHLGGSAAVQEEQRAVFLSRLEQRASGGCSEETLRLEARRSYERRAGADHFGWYERLPPS